MNKKEAITTLENLLELNKTQGHLSPADAIKFSESIATLKNGKDKKAATADELLASTD
jgi:hypothetical protein